MKDHTPIMGVPDIDMYKDIDKMYIKNQDELRAYLLHNIYCVDGYKLTFRMSDKNMKPIISYMWDSDVKISLSYDENNNLYTVTAKAK
ncbi:hypothetical protein [Paenibacillus anaericanus]|uniref:hypothetical protein n=1 Tax=Paenibacillus anaericanus TaxID=170367 RepID=UPI0027D8A70C|nr:hypothetical protein [Paenibacillus anaericanus]